MLTISENGLLLIETFEGCQLTAYQDVNGIWTIGYGHCKGVCAGQTITEQQAHDFLKADVEWVEHVIYDSVEVPLTQNQFDALCSFIYNVGPTAFRNSSALIALNNGDYLSAADDLLMWDHAGGQVIAGLLRRREAERALFLKADDATT